RALRRGQAAAGAACGRVQHGRRRRVQLREHPGAGRMNLAHWLARSAAVFGERPAIAHGETVFCTYREFAERAARGARWLLDRGLAPGDRVGLFRGNDPEYLVWLWSVWWAGL